MARIKNLPEGIEILKIKSWKNKHENFEEKLKKKASFKLRLPTSAGNQSEMYRATTRNFQWLIQYGIKNSLRLRAMGSGWSMSKVGITKGGIIDTKSLHLSFTLSEVHIAESFIKNGGDSTNLFFAQCGNSIMQVNEKLEQKTENKKCLHASGASNGQTVAGAISTGTHGGGFKTGAVHDFVCGLHIVTGPDKDVFIERASNSVVSQSFIDWLGADWIRDDDIFNAALVSFGSFGFIHGVLLEAAPIYHLDKRTYQLPYPRSLKNVMNKLDFSELKFPELKDESKELYHLEMVINPHDFELNNPKKGAYVKLMYKQKFNPDYNRKKGKRKGNFTYGDDALGIIQSLIDTMGKIKIDIVPILARKLFPLAYNSHVSDKEDIGTIGQHFGYATVRGQAASMAMGIRLKDASRVLEMLLDMNREKTFPGAFALRFVKGSDALLAFTKYRTTCVIELDGVDSKRTRKFYSKVCKRMEAHFIPYTLHWGKLNGDLTLDLVKKMYGEDIVNKWLESRKKLLDKPVREMFTNQFLERCGLDI